MSEVAVRRVTPDQHDAVMHFFDLVAYADNPNWSKCYCCERIVEDYEARTKDQNRTLRSSIIGRPATCAAVAACCVAMLISSVVPAAPGSGCARAIDCIST